MTRADGREVRDDDDDGDEDEDEDEDEIVLR